MKKVFKLIGKFFLSIIKFIDNKIVTPITKRFLWLYDKLSSNSKVVERWLSKKTTLIFVSLIIALVCFFVIDIKSTSLVGTTSEFLSKQKVTAIYNEEAYVVEGLPSTADITLIGRSSDLYLAKQLNVNEITLDLTGLGPGTHTVPLKYTQSLSSITYRLDPSSATVVIYPKVTETRTVSYDVLNADKIDTKLYVESVKLTDNEVFIKSNEETLKKVAIVKALVDLDKITAKVGEITLDNVPLVAYDKDGNVVDVEIVPAKSSATIKIVSPSKNVKIELIPEGAVNDKYAIYSMTSSVNTVTIYGTEETLAGINSIPVYVPVNGLEADKEFIVSIKKPAGVRYISSNNATVNVKLDTGITTDITGIKISPINLASGLKVQGVSKNDTSTDVIVRGVKSIIENIKVSDIQANVDLSGYDVGTYEVDVIVTGSDSRVSYTARTKKVKVEIFR